MISFSRTEYASPSRDTVGEDNDCAVRAIAVAKGTSYAAARQLLTCYGRGRGKATPLPLLSAALADLCHAKHCYHRGGLTRSQFVAQYPEGHYVVASRSHAFAIRNGTVYDWKPNSTARILWSWRVS